MTEHNHYAPPRTEVRDMPTGGPLDGDHFDLEGRSRPAAAGWQWYGVAWRLFKAQPFAWWGALLVTFGLLMLLSLVPLLNLVVSVAFPIAAAGLGACARSLIKDGRFEVGQVFDGFRRRPGALLMTGLLYMLFMLVGMGALALFSTGSAGALFTGSVAERQLAMQAMFASGGIAILLYITILALAMSAVLFAPYLVHEQNVSAPQAMLMSFKACFKNILASLVWGLSYIFWAVLATIPIGLGWLVLLPVLVITAYVAYRDIFYQPS